MASPLFPYKTAVILPVRFVTLTYTFKVHWVMAPVILKKNWVDDVFVPDGSEFLMPVLLFVAVTFGVPPAQVNPSELLL